MALYPPDQCLVSPSELPSSTYRKLVLALNENHSWKRIAECVKEYDIFTEEEVAQLKQSHGPAERLLDELGYRLCDVATLCTLLEKCQLYDALLLFRPPEPISILEQPFGNGAEKSVMVERGKTLRLPCRGTGLPPPTYQWFLEDDPIPGKTTSLLVVHNFELEHEGDYYCMVSQEGSEPVCSDVVAVSLAPERPIITMQPRSQLVCRLGSSPVISVRAKGHPQLSYQWYWESKQLDGFTEQDLPMSVVSEKEEGHYRCFIRNSAGEVWSQPCLVTVYMSPDDVTDHQPRPVPSAKVALLIGNQEYWNMADLNTPEEDVRTLAEILASHDFQIIALQNLTLTEMQNAIKECCKIIPNDAYVVFYFAGHGFEMKEKYMLPISAPGPDAYLKSDALSEGELLRDILNTKPQVLLVLLDMCLKSPEPENKAIYREVAVLHEYTPNNNLIQGYATTSYLAAYERKTDKNGLFVKYLQNYLSQDISMVALLMKVAKDMEKEKQKPYMGTNVTKDFRLSDPCAPCEEVRLRIETLLKVPEISQLTLKESGVESLVTCSPHLGVFCNALQITLTNLQRYKVICDTDDPHLTLLMERQGKDLVITVKNLQRLRCSRVLSLELRSRDSDLVDYAKWGLGKPMIAISNLWRSETELQQNTEHNPG